MSESELVCVCVRERERERETVHLSSKLLQSSDVDGTLLGGIEVTPTHAEVRGRAHHPTRQPKRVVRKDVLTSPIVILREEGERGRERGREREGKRASERVVGGRERKREEGGLTYAYSCSLCC